jgi:hypothetical protein
MAAKIGSDRFLETTNPTGITGYEPKDFLIVSVTPVQTGIELPQ